jgi:hypothetical protein
MMQTPATDFTFSPPLLLNPFSKLAYNLLSLSLNTHISKLQVSNTSTSRRGYTFFIHQRELKIRTRTTVPMHILLLASAMTLPLASALTPAGRWGHQAVYVPSEAAMYVIGGQVDTNSQITNDVLVMPVSGCLLAVFLSWTDASGRSGESI